MPCFDLSDRTCKNIWLTKPNLGKSVPRTSCPDSTQKWSVRFPVRQKEICLCVCVYLFSHLLPLQLLWDFLMTFCISPGPSIMKVSTKVVHTIQQGFSTNVVPLPHSEKSLFQPDTDSNSHFSIILKCLLQFHMKYLASSC